MESTPGLCELTARPTCTVPVRVLIVRAEPVIGVQVVPSLEV